jgi:hypothetical protein
MNVGATAFTRTPRDPHSTAWHRVMWMTAAFAMQYADSPGSATSPACDAMFTIAPPPAGIWRARCCERKNDERAHVQRPDCIEVSLSDVDRGCLDAAAGIVDEDVDGSCLSHGRVDRRASVVEPSDVELDRRRGTARGADRIDHRISRAERAHAEEDVCARFREGQRRVPADPAGGTGDECAMTRKRERRVGERSGVGMHFFSVAAGHRVMVWR